MELSIIINNLIIFRKNNGQKIIFDNIKSHSICTFDLDNALIIFSFFSKKSRCFALVTTADFCYIFNFVYLLEQRRKDV